MIDDAFTVQQTRWKTWKSYDKDGNVLIIAFTEKSCIAATRFYLKGCQEGWNDSQVVKHEGTVGGKL